MLTLEQIVTLIEGWDNGHQIDCRMVNDGGGHYDFMGLKVTEAGKEELRKLLSDNDDREQQKASPPVQN